MGSLCYYALVTGIVIPSCYRAIQRIQCYAMPRAAGVSLSANGQVRIRVGRVLGIPCEILHTFAVGLRLTSVGWDL